MDTLFPSAAVSGDPVAVRFLDILYAEDFDEAPVADLAVPPPPPEPTGITPAECEQACAAAVAAAQLDWERSAQWRQTELLAQLSAQLASADDAARAFGQAAAEALAGAVLAALFGLLPRFCDAHGAAEAQALAARLLPMLRAEPKIVVRVHADEVDDMRHALERMAPDHADCVTVSAAAVERGDLRVLWQNGALVRDARQIIRTMREQLGQFGLLEAAETSPKRSFAHAD